MTVNSIEPLYQEAMRERHDKLAAELARLTFPELHITPLDEYGDVETSFATFAIFGPFVDTMQPLERGVTRFAFVDRPPTFFTWQDELFSVDTEHGTLTAWSAQGLDEVGGRVWKLTLYASESRVSRHGDRGPQSAGVGLVADVFDQ